MKENHVNKNHIKYTVLYFSVEKIIFFWRKRKEVKETIQPYYPMFTKKIRGFHKLFIRVGRDFISLRQKKTGSKLSPKYPRSFREYFLGFLLPPVCSSFVSRTPDLRGFYSLLLFS